jgi:phage shock protein PspC (stress-responsive transcriptional regulator)
MTAAARPKPAAGHVESLLWALVQLATSLNSTGNDMKKLFRYTAERKIAGVCAGLGEYADIDPLFFRLAFLVTVFFGGIGLLVYVVMWFMVPPTSAMPAHTGRTRLHLSETDCKIAGVCGGLGEFADVDPLLFRVAFVVLAFAGGAGVFLYLALWLLMPRRTALVSPDAPAH